MWVEFTGRRSLTAWLFVPFVLFAVVHCVLLAAGHPLAAPTKLVLMPLLALPVLWVMSQRQALLPGLLLLAALLFSWLGDGAGTFFPGGPELPLMLLFFGIAHVAYIVLFARRLRVKNLPPWTIVYALWWGAMLAALGPHIGALILAVAAYGIVLAATATFAARCNPVIAWGGVFFLASDSILAFRLFLPDAMPAWTSPAVMVTYTLGQGLLVAGALLALRKATRSTAP